MIRTLAFTLFTVLAAPAFAACEDIEYGEIPYTLCTVTLEDDLRLWHSGPDNTLLGSFSAIRNNLEPGQSLGFAMNAGMYHRDRAPVGLYIENGVEHAPIADGGGFGNFGLTPNGVFCVTEDAYRVIETNSYRADIPDCRFATQSGPMLVINSDLHPRFIRDSDSRFIRNGVGVTQDGKTAVFAISNRAVNFFDFASLFKDHLHLPNALFFDGKVSRLLSSSLGREDIGFPLGPIVGTIVSER